MKKRLYEVIGTPNGTDDVFEKFSPSELDVLFTLVKTLQAKVVTGEGNLLANTSTRVTLAP